MDTAIITILAGAGVAGVWVLSFLTGWCYPKSVVADLKAENAELKQALAAANDRANAAASAQVTVKDILAALAFGRQQSAGLPPEGEGT